ncbi:MAG: transposase, partial [Elusimicrobiota bacterium]|nr:transposase [Elusimicrobiota bacterium]
FYSRDQGRPTIPLRAKVSTETIKRLYKKSDREAVHMVEENMYAQKFCELHPSQVTGYMDPENGLSNFRKKIRKEGLAFLEEVLQAAASKRPLKKGDKLIIDTTCVPTDIIYPTDIRLLERCRQEVIRLIKKAKQLGMKLAYRTYNRTARKVFVRFSKLSRPKEKTRKRVHKQMIQFVRRNFKQLVDLRNKATTELGKLSGVNSEILAFLQRLKGSEKKICLILHQQKQIYRGILHIAERIVSFHRDYVRPIVSGKLPVDTEFGPKVFLAMVNGFVHVVSVFRNNIYDGSLVLPALRWFKRRYCKLPKETFRRSWTSAKG